MGVSTDAKICLGIAVPEGYEFPWDKEDENGDGTFNANNEDEYDYEIKVDWDGWKLVSVRYTDIVTLVNGVPAVAKGNALHNPNKLGKISMLHLANPANGFASCKLDLVMFTTNKPLEP